MNDSTTSQLAEPELRRLFPPPRRQPGPIAVAVRWRRELAAAAAVAFGAGQFGVDRTGAALGVVAFVTAAVPALRRVALRALQSTVVAHRVRTGFAHAGVGSRTGRLPWIVSAEGQGDGVVLSVWLPAGVTVDDIDRARHVIAAACGASELQLLRDGPRQDRVRLMVLRPRWGSWGR